MLVCEDKLCTGCGVCEDACPKDCITVKQDKDGFYKSFVDSDVCINCKKCIKVCPANNPNNQNEIFKVYRARRTDSESILESSSGGIATLLSETVAKDLGGYVCGCSFDDNLVLKQTLTKNLGQIDKFRGSKYHQSYAVGIYKEVKDKLESGETVLFIGTPCQVSACNNFLGKEYENFYSVDLVCHGVPSRKIFDKYIEKNTDGTNKIVDAKFRNKNEGYKPGLSSLYLIYENGVKKAIEATHGIILWFASDISLRESCYKCNFTSNNRCSDISLADSFRDISEEYRKYGASMVFINTEKGEKLFDSLKDKMCFEALNKDEIIKKYDRLNCGKKPPRKRKQFFQDLHKLSLEQMEQKYTLAAILPSKFVRRVNALIKRIKKLIGK